MAFLRKIKAGLVKSDIETFVGEEGNLFFNIETGELRLSDGLTEGGLPVGGGGGGGGYILPTASTTVKGGVKVDGTTIQINNQVISGFSGNYSDLTNKPTLSTVATSGSYTDLTNKPALFSGNYNDLTNKPTIPPAYTLPTASSTVLGGIKVGSGLTISGSGVLSATGGGGSPLAVSLIDASNTVSGTVTNVTALRFDTDSGFDITDLGGGAVKVGMNSTFKTWKVDGQQDLVATGLDTIRFVAGPGMQISTDPAAGPKTITFTSTASGTTTSPIKTFNVLNEFSAPLLGKAVFVPASTDVIRSVQLTNGRAVGADLMVGLYRNNDLLNFFTIPAGNYTYKYSGLNYTINTNDYLTVNVVAGSGENFSMGLFNIDT